MGAADFLVSYTPLAYLVARRKSADHLPAPCRRHHIIVPRRVLVHAKTAPVRVHVLVIVLPRQIEWILLGTPLHMQAPCRLLNDHNIEYTCVRDGLPVRHGR